MSVPPTSVPVSIVRCDGERLVDRFWPLDYVETDAVLRLTEDVVTSSDEVCVCDPTPLPTSNHTPLSCHLQIEFGFGVWQAFRDRLIGYIGHTHYWDDVRQQWGYSDQPSNQFSLILSGMLFTHK